MKLNLQKRTFLVFGIVIILSALMAFTGFYTIKVTSDYNEYSNSFSLLQKHLLQARRNEKDFISRDSKDEDVLTGNKESKYYRKNSEQIKASIILLNELKSGDIAEEFNHIDSISVVIKGFEEYQIKMDTLFKLYKIKGFVNVGLEGTLRAAITKVEKFDLEYNQADLLTLRRNEKDFFLRLNKKYLTKFDDNLEKFKSNLEVMKTADVSEVSDSINQIVTIKVDRIIPLLDTYQAAFHKTVAVSEKIGLTHKLGLKGKVGDIVHNIEDEFKTLFKSVKTKTENKNAQLILSFWVMFGIGILVAILLAISFSKRLLESITKIKTSMNALSSGEYPEDVTIKTGDELEEVGDNLNELRDRISTAAEFSKEIGSGNLEIDYDDKFSNDVLAKAIIDMREKLKINAVEERTRAWHTEGIAKFGGILQEEKEDLNELSKILVSNLVNYLDANQAGVFVINDEDPKDLFLQLSGAYAYDRDKHIDMKVYKGEGLIGQCWMEKKRIFLTDVPDSYINITSGLGEASPNCIVIIPLPYNDDILGVLEMASFKKFTEAELAFLEELANTIAATLSGVKIASRTNFLLEESKMMQENLQAQEEEMRQNMEEMQATQDMMDSKENESNNKIKELEKQLRALNQSND